MILSGAGGCAPERSAIPPGQEADNGSTRQLLKRLARLDVLTVAAELADYVAALHASRKLTKQRGRKAITLALRQLLRLVREYPREPLIGAVREAARYGLYDLDRLNTATKNGSGP